MPQVICCHINETLVQGKITHYDPYDITVEITQPFAGFSTGCHIPCLIRSHKNYKGANGHQKAIELLSELYTALLAVKDLSQNNFPISLAFLLHSQDKAFSKSGS